MKTNRTLVTLVLCLSAAVQAMAGNIWKKVAARPGMAVDRVIRASAWQTFAAEEADIRSVLADGSIVEVPLPDGSTRTFRVRRSGLLPAALAAKFPQVQTYDAVATDDANVTAKIDYTVYGFHAMIFDGHNTSFVDPATTTAAGIYVAHYKRDEVRGADDNGGCEALHDALKLQPAGLQAKPTAEAARALNGDTLRTYRLALSCTHQYAEAVTGSSSPTKAQVLSKMTTTMNRVNGVYEKELSLTMTFVPNQEDVIFVSSSADPLGAYNSSASSLLAENQTVCDAAIGNANYDIGHAFSTGAGGLSQVGVVCKNPLKAQSVTGSATPYGDGFDIDYVVHEIGHEFGADHTFNNNQSGACYANAMVKTAFEPGSGSTIMAYAGICTTDNVQQHSDAYFHRASLAQIQSYILGDGNTCPAKTATGNKPAGISAFGVSYIIPARTPFELVAPTATDSMSGASITYCWEQWNTGDFGQTQASTRLNGPLFRSISPTASPVRLFPDLEMIRNGLLSNASIDKASGQKLPDTSRFMTFRLAVRSVKGSYGSFNLPDDSVHIDVIRTGASGFKVTSQKTAGIVLSGNSNETITWDVAGTNAAPINAANVDIYMSADGGKTWTYNLGTFPNNGSATVTVPNPDTNITAARFKVKSAGNIFFNLNSKDFGVVRNFESALDIYPIPASRTLHIKSDNNGVVQVAVYNVAGRLEWSGELTGNSDLSVARWASGVYVMKLVDAGGRTVIKKFVVQ